ncbi:hypothetical protein H2248_008492 [Termitomyces sp. 'cryptogamus']|nr:hypothetical protein H2248_008492 [Termitomyces sp. 'cryptogamus']
MVNVPPSYAATSSSIPVAQRPPLNGHGSSSSTDYVVRTKILLLGLRRAGKTSIQQVLFNQLPPKQTFYLETTMRVVKHTYDSVIPLEIWDCPGNITVDTLGAPLSQFATMIFVIDIRDLYNQPISRLVEFIVAAYEKNPNMSLEVFVHKAEKLQEDDKIENFRQIHERVSDRLLDISAEYEQVQLNFHLTSVYDHSLHEAFSKVLHKLIDSLPYLEDLLNVFCAVCAHQNPFPQADKVCRILNRQKHSYSIQPRGYTSQQTRRRSTLPRSTSAVTICKCSILLGHCTNLRPLARDNHYP